MKSLFYFSLIALIFASCQSGTKSNKDDAADLSALTITMDIQGMSCNGCVETVQASVRQLGDGISSVKASLEENNAVIELDPSQVDTVTIRKAIELNGYKVLGVKVKE